MEIAIAVTCWLALAFAMVLGNTAGFHRLLAHRSYEAHGAVRHGLVLLSALHSGSPMQWVSLHRVHHAFSDTEFDAHTPIKGFWQAHAGWLCGGVRHPLPCILFALSGFGLQAAFIVNDVRRLLGRRPPIWRRTCRELERDRLVRWLDRPFVIPVLFALQLGAAWAIGRWWGVFWLWSLHLVQNNVSWIINSVCHHPAFGSAAGHAGDRSRNVAWLRWLTLGDSFHGNHHRYPTSAHHALGEGCDPSWLFVCLLSRWRLARNVKVAPGHAMPAWGRAVPRTRG